MIDGSTPAVDGRVLVLAPTGRDGAATHAILATAGVSHDICATFDDLVRELRRGAAAILIPEEAIAPAHTAVLAGLVSDQPPWSDLPVLLLTYAGADSLASRVAIETLGNVTLLERPLRTATLLSTVQSAVRARQRQYQIRGHLEERARAVESLRIADQRKDEFLATLGHELRNPLAPLLTALHLLKAAGVTDPTVVRVSGVMERQIAHLVRLVDDLLEVSRITRGVIQIHREPIELAAVARSAVEISRPALIAARHTLHVDIPPEPIAVSGDAVRLTQVLANLLTNAAKYTRAGGTVWLIVRRDGERAVVTVRDNGIGIPPAHLDSIFDMFMQVDRSNRHAQGGLGLGLTIVRSLVAMHGGHVRARSSGPGAGSEFVVELPLLESSVAPAASVVTPHELPSRRILVVDDNRDAAETLAALLTTLGAQVSIAHSGQAALENLSVFNPDAVLLDIGMPEMDGYEVCRRIRSSEAHRDALLIALTGWGQERDFRRSRQAGFDHHLVKPPDIKKLCEVLNNGVAEGDARDARS